MDCAGIQEQLSEYIDGALDETTARTIEKHISTCKDCKETLASLRAVVKDLNTLEQMQAPADFLEKIHRRMEPRSQANRLLRKLFVPFKVKIPLQLAAAVAVSILVVLVFNFQKSKFQMIQPYEASQAQKAAEKSTPDHIKPVYKEEIKHPTPFFKKTPPKVSDSEQRTLAQRSRVQSLAQPPIQKESEPASAMPEKTGPPTGKGRPIDLALVLYTGTMGTASQQHFTIKETPIRKSVKESNEKESMDKNLSAKGIETRQKDQGETFLSRLNHILVPLKGNVLSVNTPKRSGRLESVLVEIPSENYASFCKDLSRLATFKTPPPALADVSLKTVKILISLTYPE
jgi:cell division protein FtsN